jgi:hypothetical protein
MRCTATAPPAGSSASSCSAARTPGSPSGSTSPPPPSTTTRHPGGHQPSRPSRASPQCFPNSVGENVGGIQTVAMPLSVDGRIVPASTTLLADSRRGCGGGSLSWLLLAVGSVASLTANVAVAQPTVTGRVIAAWPSFALIGSYELLMRQIRATAISAPSERSVARSLPASAVGPAPPSATARARARPGPRRAGRACRTTIAAAPEALCAPRHRASRAELDPTSSSMNLAAGPQAAGLSRWRTVMRPTSGPTPSRAGGTRGPEGLSLLQPHGCAAGRAARVRGRRPIPN